MLYAGHRGSTADGAVKWCRRGWAVGAVGDVMALTASSLSQISKGRLIWDWGPRRDPTSIMGMPDV